MSTHKDETDYTSLSMSESEDKSIENPHVISAYSNRSHLTRRTRYRRGGCCCLLIFVGLLTSFFLISRKPKVILSELVIGENETGYGTFKFINNNYYDISWKDPDISIYWLPYPGQTVGSVCYNQGDVCDSSLYVNSICAIKLGEFTKKNEFSTKARTNKKKNIPMMKLTPQELACASWMLLNPLNGMSQQIITYGHILAESEIYNFGKINIPKTYYYIN